MIAKAKSARQSQKRKAGRPVGTTGIKHKRPNGGSFAGVIQDTETLRRDAFCERLGIGDSFFRRMEREGLKTKQIGRYTFVSGRSFNDFIAGASVEPTDQETPPGVEGSV